MLIVLGADVHKKTHTFAAADANGTRLDGLTAPATRAGIAEALDWALHRWAGAERVWAVEDCRTYTRSLESSLAAADERIVRVPSALTARERGSARIRGKSDAIDALAVARAFLREDGLPGPSNDALARDLRLLSDRRDNIVAERTRCENQLRDLILVLDPEREPALRTLGRAGVRKDLRAWLEGLDGIAARFARELLAEVGTRTAAADALHKEIAALVKDTSLRQVPGCGDISAARLIAQADGIGRFRSPAAFAMFNGTAPIPASSGRTTGRVRLNHAGDRRANAAIHRISITQIRLDGPGRDYYLACLARGKTRREALRCLKRRVSDTVYRALNADTHAPHATTATTTPVPQAA